MGSRVNERTEVGVLSQEHAALLYGEGDDGFVVSTASSLSYGYDVVAGGAQRTNHAKVAALVGQEAWHPKSGGRPAGEDLFVCHDVGGVFDGGADVGFGQVWIGFEEVRF